MTNPIVNERPVVTSQHKNNNASHSDVVSFRQSMHTVNQSKQRLNDKNEPKREEDHTENLPNLDTADLNQQSMTSQTIPQDAMELLLASGQGQSIHEMARATPDTMGMVDFSTTPMSLEQFSMLLEQIIRQPAVAAQQWRFSLQNSASALTQISLLQVAPGQWNLSLGASSKSDAQLLSKNMDKLLQRLRATGQAVEMVHVDQEK